MCRGVIEMVTMNDVAKEAGVSKSTVSNVFSKKRPISKEVTEHVLQVAKKLNYKPNYFARSLTTRETRIIGLNMTGEKVKFSQFHLSLINGVLRECYERGYRLLINTISEEFSKRVEFQSSDPVDGEILLDPLEEDPRIEERLDKGNSMIVIGRASREYSNAVSMVDNDNVEAAELVTEHLIDLGHQHILFLNAPKDRTVAIDREQGYRHVLVNQFNEYDPELVLYKTEQMTSVEYGYESTIEMLEKHPQITAIIADTDKIALGVYRAAKDMGISIPNDLSVAAFSDESVFLSDFTPALTSVKLNSELLGSEAAKMLIEQIQTGEKIIKRTTISSQLSVRASTTAVKKNEQIGGNDESF